MKTSTASVKIPQDRATRIKLPPKVGLRPQNRMQSLSKEDVAIFDNIITSLASNTVMASEYSNRQCRQCSGKGYYQRNNILPGKYFRIDEATGQKTRFTPTETQLCACTEKGIVKAINELPDEVGH